LLPLLDDDLDAAIAAATAVLNAYPDRFAEHWRAGMRSKLGLAEDAPGDQELFDELLGLLHAEQVDFTSLFRSLASLVRGNGTTVRARFAEPAAFDAWTARWHARRLTEGVEPAAVAAAMDRVNPIYIARNHLVEEALSAAGEGDLSPFTSLLDVVRRPFDERHGLDRYAVPAPPEFGRYQTFCGT
jgi:serine/tyrosine/threonine adenylyltransferase